MERESLLVIGSSVVLGTGSGVMGRARSRFEKGAWAPVEDRFESAALAPAQRSRVVRGHWFRSRFENIEHGSLSSRPGSSVVRGPGSGLLGRDRYRFERSHIPIS